MKLWALIVIVMIATVLATSVTFVLYQKSQIVQVQQFGMDVIVSDEDVTGVNADGGAFHFGSINRKRGAAREFIINHVEEDVHVTIIKEGELAEWVASPTDFIVKKGEEKKLIFSVYVPEYAELRTYEGIVTVILRKA